MRTQKIIIKKRINQYVTFIVIGIISNIISFAIFNISILTNRSINFSAALGMLAGVINTYTMSRLFLKEKAIDHSNLTMILFLVYYAFAIFLTSNSVEYITKISSIGHNLSWLLCTIVASFFNFIFVSKIGLRTKSD